MPSEALLPKTTGPSESCPPRARHREDRFGENQELRLADCVDSRLIVRGTGAARAVHPSSGTPLRGTQSSGPSASKSLGTMSTWTRRRLSLRIMAIGWAVVASLERDHAALDPITLTISRRQRLSPYSDAMSSEGRAARRRRARRARCRIRDAARTCVHELADLRPPRPINARWLVRGPAATVRRRDGTAPRHQHEGASQNVATFASSGSASP